MALFFLSLELLKALGTPIQPCNRNIYLALDGVSLLIRHFPDRCLLRSSDRTTLTYLSCHSAAAAAAAIVAAVSATVVP